MSEVKQRGLQYLLMIVIILIVLATSIVLNPKQSQKPKMMNKIASIDTVKSQEEADNTVTIISNAENRSDTMMNSGKEQSRFSEIEEWYQKLLKEYTARTGDLSNHNDVVIRYYRKPKDENKIDSLKTLGFYIHERPTKKTLQSFQTNTIYYGDSIRREDVLIVAYQLKMAGIRLQAIEHSRFGDNWKSHSIELGTDTTVLHLPELSLDTIRNIIQNNPYIKTRM